MEPSTSQKGEVSSVLSTDPDGEIVFDTASGISLEEQREILAGINSLTGESRLVSEPQVTVAGKRGILFPLFVNIGAIVLLGLGFFLLSLFYRNDEKEIRENSSVLGYTERLLIREIRQETDRQIMVKEREINDILSMLLAVDAEYDELQVSVESLSENQQQRVAALLAMQEEYNSALSLLREERALILEDSRLMEVALRAQAEERARELSSRIEQGETSLNEAMEELKELGSEQERIGRIENQMSGFYSTVNRQLSEGRLEEASGTLLSMKEFLGGHSLYGSRSIEERKQSHLAVITVMERAIAASRSGLTALNEALLELEELKDLHTAMEQKNGDQEQALSAFETQSSEQSRVIADFQTRLGESMTERENQQQTLNRRDSEIQTLRADLTRRESEIQSLRADMARRESEMQTLRADISRRESEMPTLRTDITRRDSEIQTLRADVTRRDQQVSELNSDLAALRTQYNNLQNQNNDLQRRMEAAIRAFTEE